MPNVIADLVTEDDDGVETGFIEKAGENEIKDSIFPLENTPDTGINATGPDSISGSTSGPLKPLKLFLRDQEIAYLNRVMTHTGGDKEEAATILEVSLATLYRKLSEEDN